MRSSLFFRAVPLVLVGALLSACSTLGQIENKPIKIIKKDPANAETLIGDKAQFDPGRVGLVLAFSGGGTRAAALSYGVMQALHEVKIPERQKDGQIKQEPLLNEADFISSVSGGSFTAAYYGLYRDKLFTDFEEKLLFDDLGSQIVSAVTSPFLWFSNAGRTDAATKIFEKAGFGKHTFADIYKNGPPVILINATDLSQGSRFTFSQDYFDLLCSKLATFPVARAVAASAAVPVLFNPVVIKNYDDCNAKQAYDNLALRPDFQSKALNDEMQSLHTYLDKKERPFVHLVDGGITDNLGLRAIVDSVQMSGGIKPFLERYSQSKTYKVAPEFALIVVDASVNPQTDIDKRSSPPATSAVVDAVSDAQLHRYNNETLDLTRKLVHEWTVQLSTPEHPVNGYLIHINLTDLGPEYLRKELNKIPTTLGLPKTDVDLLSKTGHDLLLQNPDFKTLVKALGGKVPAVR